MSEKDKTDNEFDYVVKVSALLTAFYALGLTCGTYEQMAKTSSDIDWLYLIENTINQSAVVFSCSIGFNAVLNHLNKKRGR